MVVLATSVSQMRSLTNGKLVGENGVILERNFMGLVEQRRKQTYRWVNYSCYRQLRRGENSQEVGHLL
jgi:hypothetical protein